MIADKLISRLDKVKQGRNGSEWIACCPAHDDKTPSLTITEIEDRVLVKCWTGCSAYEICESVGLDISDLFPERIQVEGNQPIPKEKRFNPAHVLEALLLEVTVIDLFRDLLKQPEENADQIINVIPRIETALDRIGTARSCIERIRVQ